MFNGLGKKQRLYRFIMNLFCVFPIQNNKIVITSYFGKGYGDNGKYIVEKLLEKDKGFVVCWLVDSQYENTIPPGIKAVRNGSIHALYELATAKVWIDNCRKSVYIKKRKGQFYIQTWHGAIGVKKCEGDAEQYLTTEYIRNCKHDSEMADVILSGSKWGTELVKRAFWYHGEVLEIGSPRNDVFFGDLDSIKKEVGKYLNTEGYKLILYAPTFRNNGTLSAYELDFNRILSAVEQKFGGKYKILLRLHPNVSKLVHKMEIPEEVINVTDYPDMQELLLASDILITDYSSTMFEFMLKKGIVFLIALDYENFIQNEREFYFDLEKLPFPFCKTMEEFILAIKSFDRKEYDCKISNFFQEIGQAEKGIASEIVANLIFKVCKDRERTI